MARDGVPQSGRQLLQFGFSAALHAGTHQSLDGWALNLRAIGTGADAGVADSAFSATALLNFGGTATSARNCH